MKELVLVRKNRYKKGHKYFEILDNLCFLSKNLYNATLYVIRQHYFKTKEFLDYYEVNAKFTHEDQIDYRMLPAKVSKLVQQLVCNNFNSFFTLLSKKKQGQYNKPVKIPKYLHKTKGRQVLTYTKQALLKSKVGYVGLSKISLDKLKFKVEDNKKVQFIRIVPRGYYIDVEIGYKVIVSDTNVTNDRYASIDLGLNNLATVTSNVMNPFIINGKPLKSINQYYNKKRSELQSKQDKHNFKRKTTNRMISLNEKRHNKIMDYLHKASRMLVNQLVSNNISLLIIGYNKNWKQDINIGKQNNQNFVNVPFLKFVNMLKYKCALVGIKVETSEEAYTSKCSFLDNEDINKHCSYVGHRKNVDYL